MNQYIGNSNYIFHWDHYFVFVDVSEVDHYTDKKL